MLDHGVPSAEEPQKLIAFVENLKRQWVSTIDTIQDPLMWISSDYIIQKANLIVAKISSTDIRNVIGQKCYKIFADRDSPCEGCTLETTIKTNTSNDFELEHIHGEKYYEVSSQPMTDPAISPKGVVHVYRDRTEAKQLQEQLLHKEKLASIGLLAGGIAHEINNPLGGILIFSQMLLKEMDKKSSHYQDVVEIEAATQRAKAIVENLLEFARQRPARSRKKEVFSAVEALEKALKLGSVAPNSKNIEIIKDYSEGNHELLGEENKLSQVFLNLITNAFQAMPEGGTLTVKSSISENKGGRTGIYKVTDTGEGIETDDLKKIFDPFFTTKDPGEGTGLGLAICFGIIQEFKGTLSAESTENTGATFTIKLPLIKKN